MLAVVGGKGGVGKTTTALGLGAALARAGAEPLVVDSDVEMPDLGWRAGCPDVPGVAGVAGGTPVALAAATPAGLDGAAVLPSEPRADLEAALQRLDAEAPVVLDAPGGASPATAVPLRAATRALVVTTTATEAIEDAAKTVAIARNLDARPLGVVVTMAEEAPRGLAEALGVPVLAVVPPDGPKPLASGAVRAAYDRLVADTWGKLMSSEPVSVCDEDPAVDRHRRS
jgi:septum site-determining protein MinD